MNIIFSYRRKLVVILIFVFQCTIQKIYRKQRSKQSKAAEGDDDSRGDATEERCNQESSDGAYDKARTEQYTTKDSLTRAML